MQTPTAPGWGMRRPNAQHMKRVDEALTNFVNVTQGQLMSAENSVVEERGKGSQARPPDHLEPLTRQ